jgi:hypothetical protein
MDSATYGWMERMVMEMRMAEVMRVVVEVQASK